MDVGYLRNFFQCELFIGHAYSTVYLQCLMNMVTDKCPPKILLSLHTKRLQCSVERPLFTSAVHLATSTSYSGHKLNMQKLCWIITITSAFTDFFFFQQIVSEDPQLEGISPYELRPHMLLPAATLPGNAGRFQGLLGALEASAVPDCTWKSWKGRNQ